MNGISSSLQKTPKISVKKEVRKKGSGPLQSPGVGHIGKSNCSKNGNVYNGYSCF